MFDRKVIFSSFTSALVLSFILIEVTGIPLPLRDNPTFGIPRTEQVPVSRSIPYGQPPNAHPRFRRHSEERFTMNQHQGQPLPIVYNQGDQSWHSNSQNEFNPSRDQNQYGSRNYQNQNQYQQQQQPLQSDSGKNNKHPRERRDPEYRAPLNEWQTQPNGQHNSQNGFRDAYCTSPDCMAKLATNNIRNEQHNGVPSNKIPNVHPNPYSPNSGNDNQVQLPLPAQHLIPPSETPANDQNEGNFREFYGHQYGLPVQTRNYPNNVATNEYISKDPHNSSTESNILAIRASSIAIGDNIEIFRIEVDFSEAEDNEETNLEVEDQ